MAREQVDGRTHRLTRQATLRVGAGAAAALAFGAGQAQAQVGTPVRWDLVNVAPVTGGVEISPGGEASARADGPPEFPAPAAGERITFTGNGLFVPGAPRRVSGGGTFTIRNAEGATIGSGTYRVTELIAWVGAPGTSPPVVVANRIPDPGTPGAGLAVLRIAYSDGQEGLLFVSCTLVGTPGAVFEGVLGTHAFATFWDREPPQDEPFVNANRTLFTITRGVAAPPAMPAVSQRSGPMMRWDIIGVTNPASPPVLYSTGGVAWARADSAERITLTGAGTLTAGTPRAVTGGGTFTIEGPQGQALNRGTYRATELLTWDDVPGTFLPAIDPIGNLEDRRTGLATLRIAYSDGQQGVLVVSCRALGTQGVVFEGAIASHGFETFFHHGPSPVMPFVNENRTLFHLLRRPTALPATGDGSAGGLEDATVELADEVVEEVASDE